MTRTAILLSLGLLLASACGEPATLVVSASDDFQVDLPICDVAGTLPSDPGERFVVVLTKDGRLRYGETAETPAWRHAALADDACDDVRDVVYEFEDAVKASRLPVDLHIDRRAPWGWATWLKAVVPTTQGRRFACRTPEGRLRLVPDAPAPVRPRYGAFGRPRVEVDLVVVAAELESGGVERKVLGYVWMPPDGIDLDDRSADHAFREFEIELAEGPSSARALEERVGAIVRTARRELGSETRPWVKVTLRGVASLSVSIRAGDVLPLLGAVRAAGVQDLIVYRAPPAPLGAPSASLDEARKRARSRASAGRGETYASSIRWLMAHQTASGAWPSEGPMYPPAEEDHLVGLGLFGGIGPESHAVGVTGLALIALLSYGHSDDCRSLASESVYRGLAWLRGIQGPDGRYRLFRHPGQRENPRWMIGHALAAQAVAKAWRVNPSEAKRNSVQRALDFATGARSEGYGWRYEPRGYQSDTVVTGLMMLAFFEAQLANEEAVGKGREPPFAIDDAVFDGIRAWIDAMTDPETGRVGYTSRGSPPSRQDWPPEARVFLSEYSEAPTALGILARIYLGEDPRKSPIIKKGAKLLAAKPPVWDEDERTIDAFYWAFGTLALYQVGGPTWKTWNESLRDAVIETVRKDGTYETVRGSWDPVGVWGSQGGRVATTALMSIVEATYYRYDASYCGWR